MIVPVTNRRELAWQRAACLREVVLGLVRQAWHVSAFRGTATFGEAGEVRLRTAGIVSSGQARLGESWSDQLMDRQARLGASVQVGGFLAGQAWFDQSCLCMLTNFSWQARLTQGAYVPPALISNQLEGQCPASIA